MSHLMTFAHQLKYEVITYSVRFCQYHIHQYKILRRLEEG